MKRLIVNADDLGYSRNRNRGIAEAHRRGIVTSASLLANGAALEDALRLCRETPSLDVGLHLNLSEGRPLCSGHRTLVGRDGKFLGKSEARRRATGGEFDPEEVERETEAQVRRLDEEGLAVRRIDGHHHIHIYDSLARPITRAALRRGVRRIRVSREEGTEYHSPAMTSAPLYLREGLRTTDRFLGVNLSRSRNAERLAGAIRALPPGSTELMVHPGYADAREGFDGPDREGELALLTDPRLGEILEEERIVLISWDAL